MVSLQLFLQPPARKFVRNVWHLLSYLLVHNGNTLVIKKKEVRNPWYGLLKLPVDDVTLPLFCRNGR